MLKNEWKEVVMDMDRTLSTSEKRLLEVMAEKVIGGDQSARR